MSGLAWAAMGAVVTAGMVFGGTTALGKWRVSCDPVSERRVPPSDAKIDSGEYTFTLVATTGPSAGAFTQARLWLRRTSTLDTSSSPQIRRLARDAARVPLYGATIVDLAGVGLPVRPIAGSRASDPRSFDPLRPGVLVAHQVGAAPGRIAWSVLLGTTANNRESGCDASGPCPPAVTDSVGVALSVRKIEGGGFAGGWQQAGRANPRGYFCAAPVRDYLVLKRRRHIP